MLHSPQNLSKCTNTTKGSTSICWTIWPGSKHFKDSLEKIANLWGFKNSWKKWLLRYFQIHWKIYEHLNSFVSIGLQTLFFIFDAYVWLQLYDHITYSTMLWLCYFPTGFLSVSRTYVWVFYSDDKHKSTIGNQVPQERLNIAYQMSATEGQGEIKLYRAGLGSCPEQLTCW